MKKAPEAFRTISEVAEILETPAHVLRFWESKFYQIRPVKRAGGRRYYRPDDVALINGIRTLLQEQGMTIRGVQRVLQEQGVRHVASLGGPLPTLDAGTIIDADEGDVAEAEKPAFNAADDILTEGAALPVPATADAARAFGPDPATTERPVTPEHRAETPPDAATTPEPTAEPDHAAPLADVSDPAPPPDTRAFQAESTSEDAAEEPMTQSDDLDPGATTGRDARLPLPMAGGTPGDGLRPPADAILLQDDLEQVDDEIRTAPETARIARDLRHLPRGTLGARRDPVERLSRRIDNLLERMSEASGAGRW